MAMIDRASCGAANGLERWSKLPPLFAKPGIRREGAAIGAGYRNAAVRFQMVPNAGQSGGAAERGFG